MALHLSDTFIKTLMIKQLFVDIMILRFKIRVSSCFEQNKKGVING